MKKFLVALSLFFSMPVQAAEIYSCEVAQGWVAEDGEIEESEHTGSYSFYIDNKSVYATFLGGELQYPVFVVKNDKERIDIVGVSSFGTEIFTIIKKDNKLLYVKNSLIDGTSLNMMMEADCVRKEVSKS